MALAAAAVGVGVLAGVGEGVSILGSGQGLLRNLNRLAGKVQCATQMSTEGTENNACTVNQQPGHEHDAYPNAPFASMPRFL